LAPEVEDGEVDDTKIAATTDKPFANTADDSVTSAEPTNSVSATLAVEPVRKSDILMKRDLHLRGKEANLAASSNNHGRLESSRTSSGSLQSLPGANHILPSRPDVPLPPNQRMLDRDRHTSSRHGERREGRDSRLLDSNRLDRPGERPRDFPPSDRRGIEPTPRDFPRGSERVPERDRVRDGIRDPPRQWQPPDLAREAQDRNINNVRSSDSSGRLSRDNGMPPPRPMGKTTSTDRGPPINPERLPLVTSSEIINPERAALITGAKSPLRSDSPRRHRDDPRDRNSSRPQSPRRHGSDRDHSDTRRDDRNSHTGPSDNFNASRSRPEEVQPPPAGPRSDRSLDRNTDRGPPLDRPRDSSAFQQPPPPPRLSNPDHGRLNSNPRTQPDPNFGRLNPSPVTDIPSGPRDRNPRGNRLASAPQPRRDGRVTDGATPRASTPEIPTGPASNRQPRRQPSTQFEHNTPIAGPLTPLLPSPSIHPDRLRALGQAVPPPPPPPPPSSQPPPVAAASPAAANPIGVHPDRLRAFENSPRQVTDARPSPPAVQPSNTRTRPHLPPVVTTGPPSGPRASHPSPISTGPNGIRAPTGPASAVEYTNHSASNKRQFTQLQDLLQNNSRSQVGGDRMNVRGRGGRTSSVAQEAPSSAPTTPIIPPPPPPPGPPPGRPDSRDLINPARADLITGNAPLPTDDRESKRGSRREHSGRHSRRSSRSPPGTDRTKRGVGEDERPLREHRDRRDSSRADPAERDRPAARDSSRDLLAGRDVGGSSREGGRDRERDRERDRDPVRREARDRVQQLGRDVHDADWAGSDRTERGGKRPGRRNDARGEDNRRDGRGALGEDGGSGRKRHSDDGGMERGREKRARR
jgi:THO complex subunit 2